MSRKNKNGKRRNYTPKTYGRDFLTPTPIERAIQEANKPASPQAVAVSDRIACDDKCSYEYKRMCVELYRQGKWPETPEGAVERSFRSTIRKWARIEDSCGPEALRHKNQNKE